MVQGISTDRTARDAYYSILASRQDAYSGALASGQYEPFVYPWDTFAAGLLFLAILAVPRLPRRHRTLISFATFIWIVYLGLQTMLKARCLSFANGYGIGLICAWGTIISVTLLFCNDLSTDLQRLEWRSMDGDHKVVSDVCVNGSASSSAEVSGGQASVRRTVFDMNGETFNSRAGASGSEPLASKPYQLVWQSYPTSISHCMEWSADLMTTFRGVAWNWRIPTAPPLDLPVDDPDGKFRPRHSTRTTSTMATGVSLPTLRELQLAGMRDFVLYYLTLDFLKTIMITDPYFMGVADLSSSSPWPFLGSANNPTFTMDLLTRFTRLTVSICGVYVALTFIFSLSPLFFLTVLPIAIPAPHLHYITRSPILEPSLYPPYWMPLSTVASEGLAGLWGLSWHQMFRFGISEPSRALIKYFKLDRKSQVARLLQLSIAFGLSGFIHASASFATFSASRPLSGPFMFFVLQGVGIILQQQLTNLAKNNLYFAYRLPWLRGTVNVLYVVFWLCMTGPLFANDVAICGIWLFEPVPISFIRGTLWGDWLVWKNMGAWMGWHRGQTWYKSGLAIY